MRRMFGNIYLSSFWLTLTVSISLIIGGFLCPPTGEIDGSVLTATGELFAWAALALLGKALADGKVARIRHNETEVVIGDD